MSLLDAAELRRVTKRQTAPAQKRVLDALGVPYKSHPVDGSPVVAWAALEAAVGAQLRAVPSSPSEYDVNVDALEAHGKTPHPA